MPGAVLLVDDESHILRDLGGRLEKNGYVVYKADNGDDAKRIILSVPIDFGIIDLKLDFRPELGGIELITMLKRHQPKAKAIVLSGAGRESRLQIEEQSAGEIDRFVAKEGELNYILAVGEALQSLEAARQKRLCFVIMPFSTTKSCTEKEWNEIFTTVIKPAIEECDANFECRRSDAIQGSVIEHILDSLNKADLVVADLTDRNPNVFYELGVRHTLRDSTILMAQNLDDIPFDLRHYAVQIYDWKLNEKRHEFRSRMRHVIAEIIDDPKKGTSPIRKYLQL